ncbi:MAG: hypothetical protein AAGF11_03415 [Myxococcota bacterium]
MPQGKAQGDTRLGIAAGGLMTALLACRAAPSPEPRPVASVVPELAPTPATSRYEHPRSDPDGPFDPDYRLEPRGEAQQIALAILRDCLRHDPPKRWVNATVTIDPEHDFFDIGEFIDPDLDPSHRQIPGSLFACFVNGVTDRLPAGSAFSHHVELRSAQIKRLNEPDQLPPLPPVDEIPRSFQFTPEHFDSLASKLVGPIHACAKKTGLDQDVELEITLGWDDRQTITTASGAPDSTLACLDEQISWQIEPYLAPRHRRGEAPATRRGIYRVTVADAFYIKPIATRAEIVRRVAQHLNDAFASCHLDPAPPRQKIHVGTNMGPALHFRWEPSQELERRAGAGWSCLTSKTGGDRLGRLFPDLSPPAGHLRLEVALPTVSDGSER